jgi:hypothetical protein
MPVAARSKAWFADIRLLEFQVPIPPGAWLSVSQECCVFVRQTSLPWADHSSRRVLVNLVCIWVWSRSPDNQEASAHYGCRAMKYNRYYTSMLGPGDPGSIGIQIYVFYVEFQQPVRSRRTSCTQLLWKPHGPSKEDTPIYLVTFETSRLVGTRHTSCKNSLWKLRDPGRKDTHI